jgi:hypothetical protein
MSTFAVNIWIENYNKKREGIRALPVILLAVIFPGLYVKFLFECGDIEVVGGVVVIEAGLFRAADPVCIVAGCFANLLFRQLSKLFRTGYTLGEYGYEQLIAEIIIDSVRVSFISWGAHASHPVGIYIRNLLVDVTAGMQLAENTL